MHIQPRSRHEAKQRTRSSCVIEMNVSYYQSLDLLGVEARLPYACEQSLRGTARTRLHESQCMAVGYQVRRYDSGQAAKVMIEQKYARLNLDG
jgi:hypothetical protein